MKKVKIFMLILVFVSVNLYIGVYSFRSYGKFLLINSQLNIKEIFDTQPHFLRTIDIDKDNEDEIVFSYPWEDLQQISIFEPFQSDYHFHHYGEIAVPSTYSFWGADYDSKRKIYVFRFIEFANGQLILKDVDNQMNPRGKPLPVDTGSLELSRYNTAFLKPVLVDLEADGKKELVVVLLPGSNPSPGTLACIEPETGKLLWYYQTGTGIIDMEFKDLDRDGKKEIILSTYAANRGVELNGTRDRFSYVIVLDCKGELRWKEEMDIENTFSYSVSADLDDDGFYEIVSTSEGTNLRNLKSKLSVFDSHGQHKVPYFLLTNSYFTRPIVLKYKNGYRIYVGDSNGTLRILDQNLTLLEEKK